MTHVHIVGAGLAGLAAAVELIGRGRRVTLYEAAAHAGGRCRSFYERTLGRTVDNGNHLLLTANTAALSYVHQIGAGDTLIGPQEAIFPFVDLRSGERWSLRPNRGPVPWWLFAPRRRVPRTGVSSYLAGLRLAGAGAEATVADRIAPSDPLFEPFWEPLTVAALNTPPEVASAKLLWCLLRETFGRGGAACRPRIARDGLAASFVDPAIAKITNAGGTLRFNHRLRAIEWAEDAAASLDFGSVQVPLAAGDRVILAVPPPSAMALLPGFDAPEDACAIVNAHLRLERPPPLPPGMTSDLPILGIIGGTVQWIFVRGDVVSLTVSAADALATTNNDILADRLWRDTAAALGLPAKPQPPIRILKERRATFAQTPAALAKRPGTRTRWRNLLLAGDWTDTGYPATIESAVRSGRSAAALITN